MSEEWMKAAMWGLVTLAMLIVLWSSWRTYRADQAKLKKLQDFRDRYDAEMSRLHHWFDSDECALMVLDWLDLQLAGGDLRPDGSRRLEVAIHGLQAVRQAVRDSHFNDRCRGAADASCAISASASSRPRVTPEQMADLRHAYLEGVELDVFMALCLNQLLEGRTVKVISERREYLNPRPELAPFDRISEPVVRRIVNDLGEQVWPCDNGAATAEAAKDGEPFPRHVQVIYEVVEPTVDEKVDEVLRLMRVFENAWDKSPKSIGREEQQAMRAAPVSQAERETIRAVFLRNGFTIKEGQTDLKPYVYAAAEELLSIARASWQRAKSAANDSHDFKNFHRLLCERFGYTHDEKDWRRDQLSLIEWIAKQSAGVPEGWRVSVEDYGNRSGQATISGPGVYCMQVPVSYSMLDFMQALAAAPAQPAAHPDDAAVDRFSAAMKAKLAKAREKGRGGWDDPAQCSVEFLAELLIGHLGKGNAGTFEDVANFAMMLHQRDADPKALADAAAHDLGEVQRLREALRDTARWIERLPVPTQGAIRQLERIDAALAASTGQEVEK